MQVAAGDGHSLALLSGGRVVAWGLNKDGQLGNGRAANEKTPVYVADVGVSGRLPGAVRVAAGGFHSLALLSDGRVVAWGLNSQGQLGDGTTKKRKTPVYVADVGVSGGFPSAVEVVAGASHSLALLSDGRVVAWGANGSGQLGDGTTENRSVPVYVKGVGGSGLLESAVRLGTTGVSDHSLALLSGGRLVAWGCNSSGQLGDGIGQDRTHPVLVRVP